MIKHLKYLSVFAGIVFCLGCAQAASGDEDDLGKGKKAKATALDKDQPFDAGFKDVL